MKIYTKLVFNIATGEQLDADVFEYFGEIAKCGGGGGDSPKPAYSVSSQIIKDMKGPLSGAVKQDIITNPFTDYGSQQYKQAVADVRGGYGARGLEGSGIAIKGEQDSLQKIASQVQAQRAGQLVGLLGTASGAPSFPAASQGGK